MTKPMLTSTALAAALAVSLASSTRSQDAAPGLVVPAPAPENLAPAEIVQFFPSGSFLEGIALDRAGTLFVSGRIDGQGVVWFRTAQGRTGTYPAGGGTLALHPDGTMYVSAHEGDFFADPAAFRVHLLRLGPNEQVEPVMVFPAGALPNGMVFDRGGTLFVADSLLGRVWRVRAGQEAPEPWLDSELLRPGGIPGIPGANGIGLARDVLHVVNSSTGDLIGVPIQPDGSAGEARIIATGVTGDGLAIDRAGRIYVTTHPFNSVYQVAHDGQKQVIASPENGVVGPTDVYLQSTDGDQDSLYVVTDGGLFLDMAPPELAQLLPQERSAPSVVRLEMKPE